MPMDKVAEQAGSTARTVVESLASTPVVLALVVFNVLFVGFSFYEHIEQAKRFNEQVVVWERLVEKAMSYCPGGPR